MAQIIEFPGFEGDSVVARLITKGTDTIVYTSGSTSGKTNDKPLF